MQPPPPETTTAIPFRPPNQQAKNSEIVGAYAKLYQLLMTAGHDTWQDYMLDQVGTWGAENLGETVNFGLRAGSGGKRRRLSRSPRVHSWFT
jgi:hypothetical protein